MNVEASEAQVQKLRDKDEIRDVIMRFCRGIDRLDADLIRSCFHPDSYDDHGHFKGSGPEFAAFIVQALPKYSHHTTHSVANLLIELDDDDPDCAHSEAYVIAYLRRRDDKGAEWLDLFAGRYVDRFARRHGEWRIARRIVVHDWSTSFALGESSFSLPTTGFVQGRRDREDLVYKSASEQL